MDLGECEIIGELHFRELEQIPHLMIKLTEGQVLEEFLSEEEIEFHKMNKCIVELSDKQEIDRKIVVLSEMAVKYLVNNKSV